jgi:hypothetical protein
MMRGPLEVTIDDSIRAARTELGRAAREAEPTEPLAAATTDHRRRPLGMVTGLAQLISINERRAAGLRDELDTLGDWMDTSASASRTAHTHAVTARARTHGRTPAAASGSMRSVTGMVEHRNAAAADLRRLEGDYARVIQILDDARAEAATRNSLPPAVRMQEERARASAAEPTSPAPTISRGGSINR